MAKAATGSEQIDFEGMSDTQLREVIEQARETLRGRITSRLDEFKALAREVGYAVTYEKIGEGEGRRRRSPQSDLFGTQDQRREVPAKYRNPDNPTQTWSGRGHTPRWMDEK